MALWPNCFLTKWLIGWWLGFGPIVFSPLPTLPPAWHFPQDSGSLRMPSAGVQQDLLQNTWCTERVRHVPPFQAVCWDGCKYVHLSSARRVTAVSDPSDMPGTATAYTLGTQSTAGNPSGHPHMQGMPRARFHVVTGCEEAHRSPGLQ